MRRRRDRRCAGVRALPLVGLLLLTGCGVGPQDHPVSLGSAGPHWSPTAAAPSSRPSGTDLEVAVFLVHDDQLVRVWRRSPEGQDLSAVLSVLTQGLTRQEQAEHLRTAIPTNANHIRVQIRQGIARVQVPGGFDTLPNRERVLAVAQLLYTLTEQLPVRGLRLVKGQHLLDTPVGSGRLVSRPVTRDDFAALASGID